LNAELGIVILDQAGNTIYHAISPKIPGSVVKEAVLLGYDIYRVIAGITGELGYSLPKSVSVKMSEYEIIILKRGNRVVLALIYENPAEALTSKKELAIANA